MEKFKDEKTLGECRFDQRQIALKKGMSERETIKSFIHEILHALQHERGISRTDLTHKGIYDLEGALYYLVFHNDWVV